MALKTEGGINHEGRSTNFDRGMIVCWQGNRARLNRAPSSRPGNDANDCSPRHALPNLRGAAPKTTAGGEITALDSGTYGVITISKALTIQAAPGVHAELGNGTSTSPVTISVGAPDVVVLRHLHFSARKTRAGKTPRGIELLTGGACTSRLRHPGFTDSGIHFFHLDDSSRPPNEAAPSCTSKPSSRATTASEKSQLVASLTARGLRTTARAPSGQGVRDDPRQRGGGKISSAEGRASLRDVENAW